MKIAMVTRWVQQCGIATYAENLVAALAAHGHEVGVFAEISPERPGGTQVPIDDVWAYRCWRGADASHTSLLKALEDWGPDVIHVQHEFGIWTDQGALLKLIRAARRIAPLFLTPHTITGRQEVAYSWLWKHLKAARTKLVVHTGGGEKCLLEQYLYPGRWMRRIAHGSPDPEKHRPMPRDDARRHLDLPLDRTILLSLGFVGRGKRQDMVLTAVYDLVKEGILSPSEVLYVIAGAPGSAYDASGTYAAELHRSINRFGMGEYAQFREGFVPFADMAAWFGAADFCVNGSVQTHYSATGRCRLPAAYGCPQLIEDVNIHDDLRDSSETWRVGDQNDLMAAILRMVRTPDLRARRGAAGENFARATTWPIVAWQHLEWYA